MDTVRYGVVGVAGLIGGTHVRAIRQTEGARLVAVTDLDFEGARRIADEAGCEALKNHEWLIKRADIDAVCLCTPHALHAEQAISAMKAGKHVLTEKPLALTVGDADRVIAASRKYERALGVVFQYRHRPAVRAARRMIQEGQLGDLYRITLVHTSFKTRYFYEAAPWRGTWAGAGGGVLAHQAPPYLDLLVYLVGLPRRVTAWTRTRIHQIEVEDMASALLDFPGGAQGLVHFNTVQAPPESRLEIVGDRGALRLEGNALHLFRPEKPLRDFADTDRSHVYAYPKCAEVQTALDATEGTHAAVLREFTDAVREGRTPSCDGVEGLRSLEVANAMMLSSLTDRPVDLPVKRSAVKRLFMARCGEPQPPATSVQPKPGEDKQ